MTYRIHRYVRQNQPTYYVTEYWRCGRWNAHGGKQAIKWGDYPSALGALQVRLGDNAVKESFQIVGMATN